MKFSKSDFLNLDLPDLLLDIWCYADYLNDQIINQYYKWCVEAAEEQWQPDFWICSIKISSQKVV